jgi:peptidoglycan/LPS O-acetylase OafA/YrhL
MGNPRARITQLDGLRAIAIIAVMLHHFYQVKLLWMGVDLFFVLSGFLITGILFNQKRKGFGRYIGGFYSRRAKRILPAYVVILIISGFLFGFGFLRYWYLYIGGMNFLILLGIHPLDTLPLWSLAVEEQFYLLWPIAVYFLNRKQLIWCAIGLIALAPILRFLCTPLFPWHWEIYMLLPFRMDTLAAGALIALLWPELQERLDGNPGKALRSQIAIACVAVGACSLAFLFYLSKHGTITVTNSRLGNTGIYEAVLFIVTGVFLVVLLGFGKRLLSTWPFMWIGRISYSIYLFHLTAVYLVLQHGLLAVTALTFAYSLAMWFLVENPINAIGHVRPKVLVTEPETT